MRSFSTVFVIEPDTRPESWSRTVPTQEVVRRLGLPGAEVLLLAEAGIIERCDHPSAMVGKMGRHFRRSSIERLETRVKNAAIPWSAAAHHKKRGKIRLSKAVRRIPCGGAPWAGVFAAVTEGRLPLQLRMGTAFPMADGCDGLVIASPS